MTQPRKKASPRNFVSSNPRPNPMPSSNRTPSSGHVVPATCCALALLVGIAAAAPALAQRGPQPAQASEARRSESLRFETRGLDSDATPRPRRSGVPVPERQLPDLGRLQDELRREATVERFLDAHDLRHLMAVRSWVDRNGRVADRYLQDDPLLFDDSRDTVQQAAKEALRDYVKHQVGWEQMQDRMRIRVKNFFQRDRGSRLAAEPMATPAAAGEAPSRRGHGMGAFEISPQLGVDLDDSEIGVDFGYDPGDSSFWSRWELSYGQHIETDRSQLQLRYAADKRWMELTAGSGEDYQGGDFIALSFTALF